MSPDLAPEKPPAGKAISLIDSDVHNYPDSVADLLPCPWHGWEFDVCTGRALASPQAQVRTYPVHRAGERLLVEMG